MSYGCVFSPDFDRALRKIKKRDRVLFERIGKKIFEVKGDAVEFVLVEHHDRAYGR